MHQCANKKEKRKEPEVSDSESRLHAHSKRLPWLPRAFSGCLQALLGGDPTMWGASVCLSARHTDTGEREPLHVKKADTLTPRKPAKHRQ